MKPRIAVVRGHAFSNDEVIQYRRLKDDFDITFFASTGVRDHSEVEFPVVELPCLDRLLNPVTFGAFSKLSGLSNNHIGVDLEFIPGLKRRLRGFDVVHSIDYNYLLTLQIARMKKQLGFKFVATHWENIPFARDRHPIGRRVKYSIYDRLDGFFAMSERAKAALLLEGVTEGRIFTTGHCVDTEKFVNDESLRREFREKMGLRPDDIAILFVGRVRGSKGVFELIYATRRLIDDPVTDRTKVKVLIAGRGPSDKEVDEKIKLLHLEANVKRLGPVPHKEIHLLHNSADIFCLPSMPRKYWQEQLGLVFLESMSCGIPVVSTLSGSIPEVVGDAGILVQPNDHLSLFLALRELLVDHDKRMRCGRNGRERVERLFSPDEIGERLRAGYRAVIEGKTHSPAPDKRVKSAGARR